MTAGTGKLNIRMEPSTTGKILDSIGQNDEFTIICKVDGGWYLVNAKGIVGYAAAEFIVEGEPFWYEGPTAISTPTPIPEPNGRKAKVKDGIGSLALREKANASAKLICYIPEGSKVVIVSVSGSWYEVWYNGVMGYAYGKYISAQNNALITPSPSEEGFIFGTNGYIWPTKSRRITSRYGNRDGAMHNGIDIGGVVAGVAGDPIYAAEGGKVVVSNGTYTVSGNRLLRNGSVFRTFNTGYHFQ